MAQQEKNNAMIIATVNSVKLLTAIDNLPDDYLQSIREQGLILSVDVHTLEMNAHTANTESVGERIMFRTPSKRAMRCDAIISNLPRIEDEEDYQDLVDTIKEAML